MPEKRGCRAERGTEINQRGVRVDPETPQRVGDQTVVRGWGIRRGADRIVGTTRSVGVLLFGPRGVFCGADRAAFSFIYYPEY